MLKTSLLPVLTLMLVAAMGCEPGRAHAQVLADADPTGSLQTRAALEELLDRYELILESPGYSDELKASARITSARLRERLEMGDFRVGDAIFLFVEQEPGLPDTLEVTAGMDGPTVVVPGFADVPLRGVLRSEVQDHLTEVLGRIIREPRLRATGLMRLSVQGAVGQPGFYRVPADMLLGQTIMVAGGPGQDADTDDMELTRGSELIFGGEELRELVRQGFTVDQLNLQAGDQLTVPAQDGGFLSNLGVILGLVGSATLIIIQLSR